MSDRPKTIVVLAMSADGKIADTRRSPARFGSPVDRAHLEKQIALVDGVIFGAGTLRAYGTTLSVTNIELLKIRKNLGKPTQPVQIVTSACGAISPQLKFFKQPVPRWLLTTARGAISWQSERSARFDRVLIAENKQGDIDWEQGLQQLSELGLEKIAILGGGQLVASLLAADLIDEVWLTVCPVIVGGVNSPTPVDGLGFSLAEFRKLELLALDRVEGEVFLHYRLQR
jgi:5-amino-6-(5-phosphoribosylamino)uracil reductase